MGTVTKAANVSGIPLSMDPVTGAIQTSQGQPVNIGSSSGVSNMTYTSGKLTGYRQGGVNYTLVYSAGSITVTGDNGKVRTATLDGNGNFTSF